MTVSKKDLVAMIDTLGASAVEAIVDQLRPRIEAKHAPVTLSPDEVRTLRFTRRYGVWYVSGDFVITDQQKVASLLSCSNDDLLLDAVITKEKGKQAEVLFPGKMTKKESVFFEALRKEQLRKDKKASEGK